MNAVTGLLLPQLKSLNKMKRIFTLISAVIACILCIILSILICEAKTVLYLNKCGTVLDVFSNNDENVYILCNCNNNYKIMTIDKNLNTNDKLLDIDVNDKTYAFANNTFYFFSKDIEGDENDDNAIPYTLIDSYNCKTNIQHKRVINYAKPNISGTFAVDSNANYYMIADNSVEVYTSNYKYMKTIFLGSTPINLTNNTDGTIIYITTEDGLTIINNDTEYNFNINLNKIYPINNYCFAADSGEVYSFENGNVSEIYTAFDGTHGSAVIGEKIFGSKSGELTAISNGEEFPIDEISDSTYICSVSDSCLCITQNGDGVEILSFTAEYISDVTQIIDNNPSVSSTNTPKTLTSDIYIVNRSDNTLSGITPGSTIAAVRENIQGGTFTFYDSKGNLKTSGKVGTGTVIENTDTGERFCIIMYGELSGEGNINTSDKTSLVNYLLNKQSLEGVYLEAADINGDSKVNLKDYAAFDAYLKGEYNINQKR